MGKIFVIAGLIFVFLDTVFALICWQSLKELKFKLATAESAYVTSRAINTILKRSETELYGKLKSAANRIAATEEQVAKTQAELDALKASKIVPAKGKNLAKKKG
jgi:hypothetical protein